MIGIYSPFCKQQFLSYQYFVRLTQQSTSPQSLLALSSFPQMRQQICKTNKEHSEGGHSQNAAAWIEKLYDQVGEQNAQPHPH
jgi:hypothetical protein